MIEANRKLREENDRLKAGLENNPRKRFKETEEDFDSGLPDVIAEPDTPERLVLDRGDTGSPFGGFGMMLGIVACVVCLLGFAVSSGGHQQQHQFEMTSRFFGFTLHSLEPEQPSRDWLSFWWLLPLCFLVVFTMGYGIRAMVKDFWPQRRQRVAV